MKHYTTTVCCRHNMVFPPQILTCLFTSILLLTSNRTSKYIWPNYILYFTNLKFSWKKGKHHFPLRKNPTFWGQISRLRVAIPWPTVEPQKRSVRAFTSFLPASSHFNLQVLRHNGKWSASKKKRQVLLVPFAKPSRIQQSEGIRKNKWDLGKKQHGVKHIGFNILI